MPYTRQRMQHVWFEPCSEFGWRESAFSGAMPESNDLWLSTLRSPQFEAGVENYLGADYPEQYYTKTYKEKQQKELRERPEFAKEVRILANAETLVLSTQHIPRQVRLVVA